MFVKYIVCYYIKQPNNYKSNDVRYKYQTNNQYLYHIPDINKQYNRYSYNDSGYYQYNQINPDLKQDTNHDNNIGNDNKIITTSKNEYSDKRIDEFVKSHQGDSNEVILSNIEI